MKNIQSIQLDKYRNANYELIDNHIYHDIQEDLYVFALSFEPEAGEDEQYPLEDLLNKFYLHVSDFIEDEMEQDPEIVKLELAGSLAHAQKAIISIIGKRVYNSEYTGTDGKSYIRLVIE